MIEKIIQTLQDTYGAKLLNEVGPHKEVGDIDLFIKEVDVNDVTATLEDSGFILKDNGNSISAKKIIEQEFYLLDLKYNFGDLLSRFPKAKFTEKFLEKAWDDPNFEKFFRYCLTVRSGEKYYTYVKNNFFTYGMCITDSTYILNSPFKAGLKKQSLLNFLQRDVISLFFVLNFRATLLFIYQYYYIRLNQINSGKIIGVVGSDGAGKTTVIEEIACVLNILKPIKIQYMGDYDFALQPLYVWLHSKHIAIARLCYPFYYIENWCRYIKIRWWKLRGYIVLTDRWPGLNRHLRKSGKLLRLNDWMYMLYPNADTYIFVSAPADVIHARRNELTQEEIETLQVHMRERLTKKSEWYEAVNEDLDDCLNGIVRYLNERFGI